MGSAHKKGISGTNVLMFCRSFVRTWLPRCKKRLARIASMINVMFISAYRVNEGMHYSWFEFGFELNLLGLQ